MIEIVKDDPFEILFVAIRAVAGAVVAVLISFMTGILSIGFLLRYVQTKDFLPFVWYRFILGALVVAITLVRQ